MKAIATVAGKTISCVPGASEDELHSILVEALLIELAKQCEVSFEDFDEFAKREIVGDADWDQLLRDAFEASTERPDREVWNEYFRPEVEQGGRADWGVSIAMWESICHEATSLQRDPVEVWREKLQRNVRILWIRDKFSTVEPPADAPRPPPRVLTAAEREGLARLEEKAKAESDPRKASRLNGYREHVLSGLRRPKESWLDLRIRELVVDGTVVFVDLDAKRIGEDLRLDRPF